VEEMSIVTAAGLTLFLIGFLGMVATMLFGATKNGARSVFFRGSFQEAKDYTPAGWRYYKAALYCALVGFVLCAVGVFIP
jgi:hypothetical protein